jgi:hypothetical protein
MMFPLVRELADDPIHKIPVAVTCRVLGFSKQALSVGAVPGHRPGLG